MTRYLSTPRPGAPTSGLRMFCFPYAGGGASTYANWQRALGPKVRVMPVQLPGREGRMNEQRFTDLDELTEDLDWELDEELDEPHVYFGHSMGALIAFSLALRRFERGASLPRALILAAYRAPHLSPPKIGDVDAPDTELVKSLNALGGIPDQVLKHPEWLKTLMPIARDDLVLCATVPPKEQQPMPVPFHLFAGRDDPLVSPIEMSEWSRHTADEFEMRILPGRHFFIKDREAHFLDHLGNTLDRYSTKRRAVGLAAAA
jgi:surfactin synthase thioesterase subunit